jgi:hypothetical protein
MVMEGGGDKNMEMSYSGVGAPKWQLSAETYSNRCSFTSRRIYFLNKDSCIVSIGAKDIFKRDQSSALRRSNQRCKNENKPP